jgi:hypothetical protein
VGEERHVPLSVDGAGLVDRALGYVARRLGTGDSGRALLKVRQGDLEAYLYFRYALAKETSRDIAAIAGGIEKALIFLENRCEEFPGEPVRLGLVVARKTAAMQSLVEAVCEAVSREAADRVPGLRAFGEFLSVELLDAEALRAGRGLAAMVSSIYEPPITVWPED